MLKPKFGLDNPVLAQSVLALGIAAQIALSHNDKARSLQYYEEMKRLLDGNVPPSDQAELPLDNVELDRLSTLAQMSLDYANKSKRVSDRALTATVINTLKDNGYPNVGSLMMARERDLKRLDGIGSSKYHDIVLFMNSLGVRIGQRLPKVKLTKEQRMYWMFHPIGEFHDVYNRNYRTYSTSIPPLDTRALNCLRAAEIETMGQLVSKSEEDLEKLVNLGRESVNKIVHWLGEAGLFLNTDIEAV
jgi:DNA-directed RNA polymerase alpha subunit